MHSVLRFFIVLFMYLPIIWIVFEREKRGKGIKFLKYFWAVLRFYIVLFMCMPMNQIALEGEKERERDQEK